MVKPLSAETGPATSGPGEVTRQAILDAAERMFAEKGIHAVSLRSLMAQAGTNIAAAHYHFGSKMLLVEQVFARRAVRIAEQREAMLADIPEGLPRQQHLERLVDAFLYPGFLGGADTDEGAAVFAKLRARLTTDTGDFGHTLLSKYFNESSQKFITAFHAVLPHLTLEEIYWRFHTMLAIQSYTMANPGRIQSLSDHACDPSNLRDALDYYIPFMVGVFDSPALDKSADKQTTHVFAPRKTQETLPK